MSSLRARAAKYVIAVVVAAFALTPAASGTTVAFDATVVDINPRSELNSYPVVDYGKTPASGDDRSGATGWRVVHRTGNCCENYVTTTQDGRLLDFGGTYINYTDDRGATWKSVRPLEPLVNGEGAIVVAPNGDVLGIEWDPYSGDHALVFKYDAATGKWRYNELLLHTPFYDREWIAVVPGPFEIDGEQVPYLTFIKGGWPSKELWLYSTDGLTYTEASSKFVDQTFTGTTEEALQPQADASFDWIQPNSNGRITPLGAGAALAGPDYPSLDGTWSLFDGEERRWTGYRFPGGVNPEGRFQTDSRGRVHNVIPRDGEFEYRISSDGGVSWSTTSVALPAGYSIEEVDFRAHGSLGLAAVALHGHDDGRDTDRDLLYKLDIGGEQAALTRRYEVGLGDLNGSSGFGASVRFDFETVTIFPDGRVAMSFYDSTTDRRPALAIEGDTTLDRGRTPPG